jgi:hypothetical protein
MSARFAKRFLPAVVLGALALATPARAQNRYDFEYDHYQRDRQDAQQHRWEDRHDSLGHIIGDLFRYGTTDRYSSPEHYYRDQRRDDEHHLRDQDRAWDHDRRDRWDRYRNNGYDLNDHSYQNDGYYRNDHGYRYDDHRHSRDGHGRWQ